MIHKMTNDCVLNKKGLIFEYNIANPPPGINARKMLQWKIMARKVV
jgi:hypothetical protein